MKEIIDIYGEIMLNILGVTIVIFLLCLFASKYSSTVMSILNGIFV